MTIGSAHGIFLSVREQREFPQLFYYQELLYYSTLLSSLRHILIHSMKHLTILVEWQLLDQFPVLAVDDGPIEAKIGKLLVVLVVVAVGVVIIVVGL